MYSTDLYGKLLEFGKTPWGAFIARLGTVPAAELAPDDYENDDSMAQAREIVAGSGAQRHTQYPANDVDWFSVTLAPATWYRIRTAPDRALTRTHLRLCNATGYPAAENTDGFMDPRRRYDVLDCFSVAGGLHYFAVTGTELGDTGDYLIDVEPIVTPPDSFEPDDDFAHATPIVPDGPPQRHPRHAASDRDYLSVVLAADSVLYVTITGADLDGDDYTSLYTASGNFINCPMRYNYFDRCYIAKYNLTAGTYYITFKDAEPAYCREYTIHISHQGP